MSCAVAAMAFMAARVAGAGSAAGGLWSCAARLRDAALDARRQNVDAGALSKHTPPVWAYAAQDSSLGGRAACGLVCY